MREGLGPADRTDSHRLAEAAVERERPLFVSRELLRLGCVVQLRRIVLQLERLLEVLRGHRIVTERE